MSSHHVPKNVPSIPPRTHFIPLSFLAEQNKMVEKEQAEHESKDTVMWDGENISFDLIQLEITLIYVRFTWQGLRSSYQALFSYDCYISQKLGTTSL